MATEPLRRCASLLALLALAACATSSQRSERPGEPTQDSRLMTAEEIHDSGASNAWDAIRRTVGLSLTENSRGEPAGVSARGQSSFHLDDTPVVVVDGVRVMDLRLLRSIDARTISTIEFTNGIQGTLRYGTGSGGGAIVITTRSH